MTSNFRTTIALVDEANCMFSIDSKTGEVTAIPLDEYLTLNPLDRRLEHVRPTRAQAERTAKLLMGLPTGLEPDHN